MIKETEVDGVPTLIAPVAGPMHAGLVFRVGYADEVLARAGITHLIEHLALFRTGQVDYHYNGRTGAAVTEFHLRGNEQDVVAFLTGVCDGLNQLPFERLETEKQILRTEWSGRSSSAADQLALWRFGARGYGLAAFPEYGLRALSPDEVQHWVRTWFTRENAALWVAGDGIPSRLRLPLTSGRRYSTPVLTSALPVTPAYFNGALPGAVFNAIVPRGPASAIYATVLERELFRELRQASGVSYTTGTACEPVGNGTVVVTALADALPEKQGAVLGGMIDALRTLSVGRIAQSDMDASLAKITEDLRHPDAAAASLSAQAANLLTGYPVQTPDERAARWGEVTLEQVHEVAAQALQTGLLMVPNGHTADWAGFVAAPVSSTETVEGPRYRSKEPEGSDLIVGAVGVSRVGSDHHATVRYDQLSAMLSWPDGARQLIGHDGITVSVEPTLIAADPALLQGIGAGLPPYLVVPMPAREAATIPQPTPPGRRKSTTRQRRSGLETAALVIVGLATVVWSLITLISTASLATSSDGDLYVVLGVMWFVEAVFLVSTIALVRRRRG